MLLKGPDSLLIDYGLVAIILVSLEAVMSSRVESLELDMPLAAFGVSDIFSKLRTNASAEFRMVASVLPLATRVLCAGGAGD